MSTLEIIGTISSIVTAVIALVSVYPLFRSLSHSEQSLRFGVYYQILEMIEETREFRHYLYERIPEEPMGFDFSQFTSEDIDKFDKVARSFDKLGLFVKYKLIPMQFVVDVYGYPIILTWRRLCPYIYAERIKRSQPDHYITFEILASEVKKRHENHSRSRKWQIREL